MLNEKMLKEMQNNGAPRPSEKQHKIGVDKSNRVGSLRVMDIIDRYNDIIKK